MTSEYGVWNPPDVNLDSDSDSVPYSDPDPGVETTWLYMKCPSWCLRHLPFTSTRLSTSTARHFSALDGAVRRSTLSVW